MTGKNHKAILEWHRSAGVDETLSPTPTRKRVRRAAPVAAAPSVPSVSVASASAVHEPPAPRFAAAPPSSATAAAPDGLRAVTTLAALRRYIENFEGCDLKKGAATTVFADGVESADIMLVGEAPGAEEDKQGKPFVGKSGQLLDRVFASVGLTRQTNLYISNIVNWRPPENRTPTLAEMKTCVPLIRRHIELKRPKLVVLVGGVAVKALIDPAVGIMTVRGQWINLTLGDGLSVPAMPLFHPAFLLRSPGQKKLVWADMLTLQRKARDLGLLPS